MHILVPRCGERDKLSSNSLMGKITLDSTMSQSEIFDEIRDVFK